MNNSKKYFSSLLVLSLIVITHSINSMEQNEGGKEPKDDKTTSISGTARKKARAVKKRFKKMADSMLGVPATTPSPSYVFIKQVLTGTIFDTSLLQGENENEPLTLSNSPILGSPVFQGFPEEIQDLIVNYVFAKTLTDALNAVQGLCVLSEELSDIIYNDPNVFIPMINYLKGKFKNHSYAIAQRLNHAKALDFFAKEMLGFEG